MSKKASYGIILFGIFLILYALIVVSFIESMLLKVAPVLSIFSNVVNGILFTILLIGFFRLKKWARLAWLMISVFFLLLGWICILTNGLFNPLGLEGLGCLAYIIYPNGFGIPTIVFLTRYKVKEQFKDNSQQRGEKCSS